MAIRIKNLDLEVTGSKLVSEVFLGDVTADGVLKPIFVAPYDCVVNFVDLIATSRNPPAQNCASVTLATVHVCLGTDSAAFLQVQTSVSASALSNAVSANQRLRLTPSSNNSLTIGTPISLFISAQASGNYSQTIIAVTYTPLKHRVTR